MLKARLSTTAILVAFILIASFAAALFPQAISPQPALAETVQTVFNSSTTWTVPSGVTSVQVLVVAGGGGGGGASILDYAGGGGGAGGLVYNSSYSVTPGTNISVTVGAGGAGGSGSNGNQGTKGGNSVFGSITAIGGGYGGGGWAVSGYCTGGDGGSGGGGGVRMGYYSGGSGTSGQGYDGGDGTYPCCWFIVCTCPQNNAGGGGGGAGAAGAKASSGQGGSGGVGLDYSATFGTGVGASGWFAGGGGGGAPKTGGAGGTGGGGNGGGNANGASATANTGGGGGGGGAYSATIRNGGNGGSGVVIVKYTVPDVGTISLWTTGGSPYETTSMTPQLEYNIKVPVTDDDTLDDLSNLKVTLYYDSDGSYNEGEVPSSGNTQTAAILTWTNAEPNTWTIDPSSSTTWSINSTSSVEPTLSNDTGTFEFHFVPGKVATETTGSAKWHIYVKATDSAANTGTGSKQNLTMGWYGEIVVNTGSVDWGTVDIGSDFSANEESAVSVTYICNGDFNKQIKASGTWGTPPNQVTLNASGGPLNGQFSLKATNNASVFYDDFDGGNLSNWDTAGSPWTVTSSGVYLGPYSGYASGSQGVLSKTLSAMTTGRIEVKAKFGETNKQHYPVYNGDYLLVAMSDGHFGYYNGSVYKNLPTDTTYSAGTWYDCKVYVDLPNDRYKVYIDDSDKGWITDNAQLNGDSDMSPFSVLNAVSSDTGTIYIDQYKVRRIVNLNDASLVLSSGYTTIDSGFQTSESGEVDTSNSIWLKLGPSGFPAATFNGTIYYQISDG